MNTLLGCPNPPLLRSLDPAQRLEHFDQGLLGGFAISSAVMNRDGLQRLGSGLRQTARRDDDGFVLILSERARRRGRHEHGNDGSFSRFPPSACVPACRTLVARGNAMTKRAGLPPRPRGISHHRSRPVSGLVGSGVSPSRRLAPTVAGWIRPHALTVAGQQRHWQESLPHLFPVSTPARGTRRDTSNERVDCTTQVTGRTPAATSGIYIEMNPYTLT